jgi:Uma2 family endonuclease
VRDGGAQTMADDVQQRPTGASAATTWGEVKQAVCAVLAPLVCPHDFLHLCLAWSLPGDAIAATWPTIMSTRAERLYTADEYLVIERASDHKSELVNGRMYAMTGATFPHNRIVSNIVINVGALLQGRRCSVLSNDQRVKVSRTGMYTYPDVIALCDPPQLEDAHLDTLLNPSVIFEVLSKSTELYDRGEKFSHYRKIESLREYILVAQNEVRVEQFVRHGDHWMLSELVDLSDVLRIQALGCEISLGSIYDQIELPNSAPVRD